MLITHILEIIIGVYSRRIFKLGAFKYRFSTKNLIFFPYMQYTIRTNYYY